MRRLRWGLAIGAAALLVGSAALARDPQPVTGSDDDSQGALSEPADPDDADDIAADHSPDDVGQKALQPPQTVEPGERGADDAESDDD